MEITWKIEMMERQTSDGGVVTAHWRAIAIEDSFSANTYGVIYFTPNPNAPGFVPYEQLTEDDVLKWVWKQVDKAETEAYLTSQIEVLKNPPVLTGLPW